MDVVKNVLKNQNTDVDTVSGATYSSKGLLGAIKNALKQAEKVTNGESIEEKADTTELENAVKSAEALVMEEYTQSSWAVLSLRLNDAKELLETAANEKVEQQTVGKAVENLNLAVAQLEKKKSDQEEEVKTKYIDGTYEVSVPCKPDEDEDFTEYQLSMKVKYETTKLYPLRTCQEMGMQEMTAISRRRQMELQAKKVSFPRSLPKECQKKSIRYPEQPVLRMRLLTDAKRHWKWL